MNIEDAIQFADDRPTSCDEVLYQWAVDAEEVIRKLAALVEAQQPAPSAAVANTKTAELLSTTVGLLMGYREGGARQPYKQGSVVAKVVDEVVDHLKDWPHSEPSRTCLGCGARHPINPDGTPVGFFVSGPTEDSP